MLNKSELLLSQISDFPSLEISLLPTPVHKLNMLSDLLGADLFCKRDDLTAFAFGGNKTRKLDYLVRDAIDKDYDCLITFGAVQSNWCRMTSMAGRVHGLDVFLVLAGERPEKETANLLIDRLAGADISFIESLDRNDIIAETQKQKLVLEKNGRKPYFMPVGGSVAIGSLGYIKAMAEILEFSERYNMPFSHIILASGSAGTQAGLVAGQLISGWEGTITGIGVSRAKGEQEQKVFEIARDCLELTGYEYNEESLRSRIRVDDSYLGDGYRIITPECKRAIEEFARYEGILLDEVYTGKAAAGLIDYAKKGLFEGEKVLFIHTGGNIQLFE